MSAHPSRRPLPLLLAVLAVSLACHRTPTGEPLAFTIGRDGQTLEFSRLKLPKPSPLRQATRQPTANGKRRSAR
mgnify:CR=1 FL=1